MNMWISSAISETYWLLAVGKSKLYNPSQNRMEEIKVVSTTSDTKSVLIQAEREDL